MELLKFKQKYKRDLDLISNFWFSLCGFNKIKPTQEEMIDFIEEHHASEEKDNLIKNKNMKHLMIALSQAGQKEVSGKQDNPEITKYFDALGFDGSALHDETSWCAAFANWVLKTAGLPYQKTLNARSFLKLGDQVEEGKQEQGDIVVFWREKKDSWKGHVAFYIRENKNWIYCLGGNQGNTVKVSAYPKNRLLQYRRVTNKQT